MEFRLGLGDSQVGLADAGMDLDLSMGGKYGEPPVHLSLLPHNQNRSLGFDVNQAPPVVELSFSPDSTVSGCQAASVNNGGSSKEQLVILEESFKEQQTIQLNQEKKMAMAEKLNLRPNKVAQWFRNRRNKTNMKQNEVDIEYFKRCCEHLTEENRRLQKENSELRACVKLLTTTQSVCPSCVASTSATASDPQPNMFA